MSEEVEAALEAVAGALRGVGSMLDAIDHGQITWAEGERARLSMVAKEAFARAPIELTRLLGGLAEDLREGRLDELRWFAHEESVRAALAAWRAAPVAEVRLRPVKPADLELFFTNQLDPVANHMAAFTAKDPTDRAAFLAKYTRILGDRTVVVRTIEADGSVVGSVLSWMNDGAPEVSYWISRSSWGRGIASRALLAFLAEQTVRPIHAHVAKDNLGSRRVLEKCGFRVTGEERGFANARGAEIDELVLTLER